MTSPLSDPDASLVERVRKLLDKAARTDNVHEADVFARKAAVLVARHRIDPSRLAARAADDVELVEIEMGRGAYVRARLALLCAVADAHDVRAVFRSTPTGTVAMLAGFGDDLRLVEVMYVSLHQQVASQMAHIRRQTGAATQRHRRAFLFGFAERLGELMAETRSSIENESGDGIGLNEGTELVLRARNARVDDFAERSWGRVRSAAQPAPVSADGFARGVSAADRADVGRSRLAGRSAIGRGA